MSAQPERKPVILVIEDYGDSRRMLKLLLDGEGYEVLTAANSDEALEALRNQRFDLIVTDFGLPGLDGMGLVRRIRKLHGLREIPIIMLTALEGKQYNEAALRAGCTDFLTKPIDIEKLNAMIERLLSERSESEKENGDDLEMSRLKS